MVELPSGRRYGLDTAQHTSKYRVPSRPSARRFAYHGNRISLPQLHDRFWTVAAMGRPVASIVRTWLDLRKPRPAWRQCSRRGPLASPSCGAGGPGRGQRRALQSRHNVDESREPTQRRGRLSLAPYAIRSILPRPVLPFTGGGSRFCRAQSGRSERRRDCGDSSGRLQAVTSICTQPPRSILTVCPVTTRWPGRDDGLFA